MKYLIIAVYLFIPCVSVMAQNAGHVKPAKAKFITGNAEVYKTPGYDDSKWESQNLGETWQVQGHPDYHGYAWYRIHVKIPSTLKTTARWKDSLRIFLAHVNDVDATYLNGKLIGSTGSFPDQPGGYISKWPAMREYHITLNDELIHWDGDNVIAVKVFDGGGTGGIFMGKPYVDVLEKINGIDLQLSNEQISYQGELATATIFLRNQYAIAVKGNLQTIVTDKISGKILRNTQQAVQVAASAHTAVQLSMPNRQGIVIHLVFKEASSGLVLDKQMTLPYLLTPAASEQPAVHGPTVIGVQPNHPLIYKIPVTGRKPYTYSAENLPAGLELNAATGLITGTIATPGDYAITISVKNPIGFITTGITIKVGNTLALTPPMGWNSWNCWGTNVSDEKVRSSAQALIDKGLMGHGWNYINVDDGWEAKQRASNGMMPTNEKFPDMKKLGDFLHGEGLRFGIYSSPGTHTCGGYLGSYEHELQDANMYAAWGIDYLKYDLFSYLDSMKEKVSLQDHQRPFQVMQSALAKQNRDIVYSVCQYGLKDVWKWGRKVNGNLWRTTEDIEDTWESLYDIGFKQDSLYWYASPGGWNDPDMLTVGMVGWGENLHPTRLTPDEQYTQLSLWSMLSAPLLIGCDISRVDPFTLNLLTNDEVIAIDQDILGKQARKIIDKDSIRVYVKDLSDGSKAVAVFNLGVQYKKYKLLFTETGLPATCTIRDTWKQSNLGVFKEGIEKMISPHGVLLMKIN